MAFDFKKAYKEFYLPPQKPVLVEVPTMKYLAVEGKGDPNEIDGAYQEAISKLYSVAYTLKMSYKTAYKMEGFYEYVVPPLEGFWQQAGVEGVDYDHKESFEWLSVIRLPEFVSEKDVAWAKEAAFNKKKVDCSSVGFLTLDEGLCVQMMHIGPYDDEPESVALMDTFIKANGYETDFSTSRRHHEIYLCDPRKTAPEKRKTVLRHPIKKRAL